MPRSVLGHQLSMRLCPLKLPHRRPTCHEHSTSCAKRNAAELQPQAKQKSHGQDCAHSDQDRAGEETLKKPDWIRVKAGSPTTRFYEIKDTLRANKLHTVCEEASLPQHWRMLRQRHGHLHDHGRQVHAAAARSATWAMAAPTRWTPTSRANLAKTIAELRLKYVVITSVDRDDLRDGGAGHLCRLHPADARALAQHPDRGAGARLPRPAGQGARHPRPTACPT